MNFNHSFTEMIFSKPKSNTALALWAFSIICIAGLSVFGRKIQLVVLGLIDQRWLAAAVFLVLLCILGLIWLLMKQQGRRGNVWVTVIALLVIGAGGLAVYKGMLQPVEAVHFLIFSWVGWISSSAFGPLWGIVAVLAVACGDELLQYFLPDRVGDLHDMVINGVSGGVGLLLRGK